MQKKVPLSIAVAAAICLLTLLFMIAALLSEKPQITQPFTPPPFDASAVTGTPTVPNGLGWQELDAQVFKASVCGEIVPTGGKTDIWLTSPESNTVWIKLRVLDIDGNILGETGLIKPGEYLQSVSLTGSFPTGTPVILKIMAYEPNTYHSAGSVTLNTTIKHE